ncbi:glycosyltransferase [Pseudomonadota bacterium]
MAISHLKSQSGSRTNPTPGLISIVIPCYNAKETIREAIDSALNQNYATVEVIVIDDGSTDQSSDVVLTYGEALRFTSSENFGVSHARNKGTKLARGEFIQYLDSDDVLAKNTIQRRVDALLEMDADVAYTDWQKFAVGAAGRFQYGEKVSVAMEDVDKDPQIACATAFWVPPAAVLYRTRIVEAIGSWNETLTMAEDARFLFDAAYNGARFVRVPGVGAYYREDNPDSLSKRNKCEFATCVLRNANQIQALWISKSELSNRQREALISIYDYAARELFNRDEQQFMIAVNALNELAAGKFLNYTKLAGMLTKLFGIGLARIIIDKLLAFKAYVGRPSFLPQLF